MINEQDKLSVFVLHFMENGHSQLPNLQLISFENVKRIESDNKSKAVPNASLYAVILTVLFISSVISPKLHNLRSSHISKVTWKVLP